MKKAWELKMKKKLMKVKMVKSERSPRANAERSAPGAQSTNETREEKKERKKERKRERERERERDTDLSRVGDGYLVSPSVSPPASVGAFTQMVSDAEEPRRLHMQVQRRPGLLPSVILVCILCTLSRRMSSITSTVRRRIQAPLLLRTFQQT